jgi:hypothetical protein
VVDGFFDDWNVGGDRMNIVVNSRFFNHWNIWLDGFDWYNRSYWFIRFLNNLFGLA